MRLKLKASFLLFKNKTALSVGFGVSAVL